MTSSRPPLKVTNFDPRTLAWWNAQKNKIDMDPPYQRRGRLWSATDKGYLIDSILNSFDVPKFYIADFTYSDSRLNKKQLPYAIIDGKQRFEAIFDFFDGKITLNPDFVFLENSDIKIGGLGYKDLVKNYSEIAEIFDNHSIAVMSVITDSEPLINELFVRLNRSKPLTGAEIRNAMAGPAPDIIRELASHEFFLELISFPVKRGQDLNAVAKLLLFEFSDRPQETKKGSLDSFVISARRDPDKLELAARRVHSMLNNLAGIFLPKDKILGSAGVIPVYYWFIRNIDEKLYSVIRDFLVRFEIERKENRMKAADGMASVDVDRQLLEYDRFNRSTNDLISHNGRISILSERFRKFISK